MKVKLQFNDSKSCLQYIEIVFAFMFIFTLGLFNLNAQNPNANENATVDGGYISTTDNTTICLDGIPDPINVTLEGASGRVKQWIITDDSNNILGLPPGPPFDLDGAPPGVCRIWHLSYNGIKPLVDPFWHKHVKNLSDLRGKYDLSNYIEVTRIPQPDAGEIIIEGGGTELEICAGDGESDAFNVEVTGSMGGTPQWIITNNEGKILGLPDAPPFDLEDAPEGVCLIWYLRYEWVDGLKSDQNVYDLTGCFDLSNKITVVRNGVGAGDIYLDDMSTETTICAGDGVSDALNVNTSGAAPGSTAWIITDDDGEILALPDHGPPFDLEGAGEGTCLIWYLSYEEGLEGAIVGNNANTDLSGCYDLSNPITVIRNGVGAGDIYLDDMTTEITICAGDGVSDAFNINTSGAAPGPTTWIITDADANILAIPDHGPPFDLEGAGEGTCLIWYLSYEEGLEGLEEGNNTDDLEGCFSISNSISVIRHQPEGGTLVGGPFEFTVGDGEADHIADGAITLSGNSGTNSQWVVTNEDGTIILGLPGSYTGPNFDGAGAGTCKIWHLSYDGEIQGLVQDGLVAELVGCYSWSNAVDVVRTAVAARIGLFPNPAKDVVNLDLSKLSSKDVSVNVYNLQNVKMLSKTIKTRNRASTSINVSAYLKGIYFVSVTDNVSGRSYIKRLIVK